MTTGPARAEDFLARLSDDDRRAFVGRAAKRPMVRGEILFFEGQQAGEVLVVGTGIVKVWITAGSGRSVILNLVDAGSILGEVASIDGDLRSAAASALTDGMLLAMPTDVYRTLVDERPAINDAMLHVIAGRLRGASQRQLQFSSGDALGRLCGALVELAERYGTRNDGALEVLLPMGQGELGDWSGISREAVVKALKALRMLGWITSDGRNVRLLDPEAMRARSR
jgi:CRP-like cAMP-binding protein